MREVVDTFFAFIELFKSEAVYGRVYDELKELSIMDFYYKDWTDITEESQHLASHLSFLDP